MNGNRFDIHQVRSDPYWVNDNDDDTRKVAFIVEGTFRTSEMPDRAVTGTITVAATQKVVVDLVKLFRMTE